MKATKKRMFLSIKKGNKEFYKKNLETSLFDKKTADENEKNMVIIENQVNNLQSKKKNRWMSFLSEQLLRNLLVSNNILCNMPTHL